VRGDDGGRGAEVHEVEEEEAIAARGAGVPEAHAQDVAVGVHGRLGAEADEVGDARGALQAGTTRAVPRTGTSLRSR
jgi:hypothetical protein